MFFRTILDSPGFSMSDTGVLGGFGSGEEGYSPVTSTLGSVIFDGITRSPSKKCCQVFEKGNNCPNIKRLEIGQFTGDHNPSHIHSP